MKTTLEIHDELMGRAKRYAKRTGRPLRTVVEERLRRVLTDAARTPRYELPDRSVGAPSARDPLEAWSWQDLRDENYAERSFR
jgi:hypothetical protein